MSSSTDLQAGFSSDVVILSFFYNLLQNSGQTQLSGSTGVSANISNTKIFFNVEKTASVNTRFAWPPFSILSEFQITVRLFDTAGILSQTQNLTFEGHRASFFTEVLGNVPDRFVGHVSVESEENVHLVVLRLEFTEGGFQLTSIPPRCLIRLLSSVFAGGDSLPQRYSREGAAIRTEW